ncbi:MAG: U32 family peptidase [Deltaproteobacteria bacterium]|nr:U32 family peptidase [Deltaproteobacteria bacterium]
MISRRPEILAPAGDEDCLRAAIRAGADAVYFGLQGHNARARAKNFEAAQLPRIMGELHAWGVKGYVTLNTLAFDHELGSVEEAIRACAAAGVDAVIVQDLGVVRLCRELAPGLEVHASTQMTCTDAASVDFAARLGATRVVLARELSVDEIRTIKSQSAVEIEVFVHGALCVSYSGQCLTSEAIGGRSANRGACAQACRLPYDLVVDGVVRDLGDIAYLLSPQDLEAARVVPELADIGVSCLKIEGRLKGPEYVAAATRLYRAAVDAVFSGLGGDDPIDERRRAANLTFSRGSGHGFFGGVDHQALVDGHTCDHRGVDVGRVTGITWVKGKAWARVSLTASLKRGDGVLLEGGRAGRGERGGRVWDVVDDSEGDGSLLWLGPEVDLQDVVVGRRVFHNDDPVLDKGLLKAIEDQPAREAVDVDVSGSIGARFTVHARSEHGLIAVIEGDADVVEARTMPLDEAVLRDKLGAFGDTPFVLRTLTSTLPENATLPLSALKRARRALESALLLSAEKTIATTTTTAAELLSRVSFAACTPAPAGLFVLCRTLEQAEASFDAGADGVWLDFLGMQGLSIAVDKLRGRGFVGLAPPRIRKPGEEKITRFLSSLAPDGLLVRGLGVLQELAASSSSSLSSSSGSSPPPLCIGDFSLNVTNRLSAFEVLSRGLRAFTPSFDLDEAQLMGLLQPDVAALCELVVHHPMPLFHTEHCVFAALLSDGKDHRTCGRPCESHVIALRDRAGVAHPVEADIGCRNTVFHALPQSAASLVPAAQRAGVARFRLELVREDANAVKDVVGAYRSLLAGTSSSKDVMRSLRTGGGYGVSGVVKGSLRVLEGSA